MTTENQVTPEQAQEIWDKLDQIDAGTASLEDLPPGNANPPDDADTVPAATGEDSVTADPLQMVLDRISGLEAKFDKTTQRLYNVEGHIGGLNAHIKKVQEEFRSRGRDTPTAKEIDQAQKSPEAMKAFAEEYPDFAEKLQPVFDAVKADLQAQMPAPQEAPVIPDNIVTREELEAWREDQLVESKHEGWKDKVKTDAFRGWFEKQEAEVQALAHLPGPANAIRLLDLYDEATKVKAPAPDADQLLSHAALPKSGGRRVNQKSVDDMTPEEYWSYLDELDRQKQANHRR